MVYSYKWKSDENGRVFEGRAEVVNSSPELLELLKSRSDKGSYKAYYDGFISHRICSKHPEWSGFSTPDELENWLSDGMVVKDPKAIASVKKALIKPITEDVDKLCTKTLDVTGGVPIVPLVLAGVPNSMMTLKHKQVPSKVISLMVMCSDTCDVSVEQMRRAATGIFQAISSLEHAGYRIRLYVVIEYFYDDRDCHSYILKVKSENQQMNLSKALYILTEPSFFRGIGFDWHTSDPNGHAKDGLGCLSKYTDITRARYLKTGGISAVPLCVSDFTRTNMSEDDIRTVCITKMLAI